MVKKSINVLIITDSAWSDSNSIGNTLSNFFNNWNNVEFSNLYARTNSPNNKICSNYYSITEKEIMANILTPSKIGRSFKLTNDGLKNNLINHENEMKEKKFFDFFRKYNNTIFLILRDIIWGIGLWKNEKLTKYLSEVKPDIIFAFCSPYFYQHDVLMYCKKNTKAKLSLFIADDIYSYNKKGVLALTYKFFSRKVIKRTINASERVYGASGLLCDEYSEIFKKDIVPLYKGCDTRDISVNFRVSNPIKIVYAGNLFWGRHKTIGALVDAMEIINKDSIKVVLEIYTNTSITSEIEEDIIRENTSKIMGSRSFDEIKGILNKADIVLHAESFNSEDIKTTRLSFSTKIIDCMQSGNCIMAIGPDNIASIEYLKNIDGPLVITNRGNILSELHSLVKNSDDILNRAKKVKEYAIENHNIFDVQKKMQEDFKNII